MKLNNYIFANAGLQINFMKVSNKLDEPLVDAMNNRKSMNGTIFWNDFKEKDGGLGSTIWGNYYQQIEGRIGLFSVYRKTPVQKFYEHICELTEDYEFIDYNITDNNFYHYLVAFKTDETDFYTVYQNTTASGDEDYIATSWDSWSITNITETSDESIYGQFGDVWTIKYNLSAGSLASNTSVSSWNTLGKYPKISAGVQNYKSGQITCLIGDIVKHIVRREIVGPGEIVEERIRELCNYTEKINVMNKYAREVEKFEAWNAFITDGELKLLKDNKGHSWIVSVSASPSADIDYNSNLQQTSVTFQWQEVMSTDNISIINSDVTNIGVNG